jgi:hypothetical protein
MLLYDLLHNYRHSYVCVDVTSDDCDDGMIDFTHHSNTVAPQHVCADVFSDYMDEQMSSYTHHNNMAAPHYVCAYVSSEYSDH